MEIQAAWLGLQHLIVKNVNGEEVRFIYTAWLSIFRVYSDWSD